MIGGAIGGLSGGVAGSLIGCFIGMMGIIFGYEYINGYINGKDGKQWSGVEKEKERIKLTKDLYCWVDSKGIEKLRSLQIRPML